MVQDAMIFSANVFVSVLSIFQDDGFDCVCVFFGGKAKGLKGVMGFFCVCG